MIGCLPSCENKPSAPLAQSVEHLPFKQGVRGSNPRRGTRIEPPISGGSILAFGVFSAKRGRTPLFNLRRNFSPEVENVKWLCYTAREAAGAAPISYFIIRKIQEGMIMMWFMFALLSAVFAALTSILAKIGIDGVNSNLATAIRTVVVVLMAWGMVFLTGGQGGISGISRKSWLFLILSGLATGASWLCYYKALQMGEASKVVPIDKLSVVITLVLAFVFLHEKFTPKSLVGCVLITIGTLVMVL